MSWKIIEHISSGLMLIFLNPLSLESFAKNGLKMHLKIFNVGLITFYTIFSAIFVSKTVKHFALRTQVEIIISSVENVMPIFIAFFISVDFVREKQFQKILKISNNLEVTSNEIFSEHCCVIVKLLILLVSKLIQMFWVDTSNAELSLCYVLSYMFPEFVLRACCQALVFYINCGTRKINKLQQNICDQDKLKNEEFEYIESEVDKILKNLKNIEKFYSKRLFVIITYDIFLVIVSFYWIFIRAIYDHMNVGTFAYLAPPVISLFSVFNSSHKFHVANRKLFETLMSRHKDNEMLAYKFVAFLRYHHYHKPVIVIMRMIPLNFSTTQKVRNRAFIG